MNESQKETVEVVREVVKGVTDRFPRSYYLERARDHGDIAEMWNAMAEQGLLGLGVSEEYGGSGHDLTASVAFIEAMSEAGVPQVFVLATSFVRHAIFVGGTREQRERYIPPTVVGKKRLCFALTEPDAGTNSFNISTRARVASDGGYVLNGQKTFISHFDEADAALVVAKVDSPEGTDEIGLFVLDLPAEGVVAQRLNINLFTPDDRFHVFFDDVHVPAENRIGAAGEGKRILFTALNPERFLIAAMCLGLGSFALEKGVRYAKERAPFGTPIGGYQGVAHPFARAKAHLDAARLMIYDGVVEYQTGDTNGAMANMAKFLAAEAANEAVDACIQAHGGSAFDEDTDVITLWPIIRLQRIAPVNDQMILNYISQHVLGLPKSY